MKKEPEKKDIAKAYGKYAKQFTPKPKYFLNCLRAFGTGGAICALALRYQNFLTDNGIPQEDAGIFVTLTLIAAAQILTGIGVFDVIAKFAGAGVIVPITGFANSVVSSAIEHKREGVVLGLCSNMFQVAGPVIVFGISSSVVVGIIVLIFKGAFL